MAQNHDTLQDRLASLSPAQRALFEERLRGERSGEGGSPRIPRRLQRCTAPLSFAQQRLWFYDRLWPNNPAFNESLPLRIRGQLRVAPLVQSIQEIVRRQQSLRTTFPVIDGQPTQQIAQEMPTPL